MISNIAKWFTLWSAGISALIAGSKKTYAAAGTTAAVAVLTFNEIVSVIVLIISAIISALLALSNHKKNNIQNERNQAETELTKEKLKALHAERKLQVEQTRRENHDE